MSTYAVDDEFGNLISVGMRYYSDAVSVARIYLSAHKDAPAVTVYEHGSDGSEESWELTREDVLT